MGWKDGVQVPQQSNYSDCGLFLLRFVEVCARRVSAVRHAHRCPNEYRLLEVPELPSACPHWPAGPRQQAARRSADLGALPTDRSLAHVRVLTHVSQRRTARHGVRCTMLRDGAIS